MYRATIQLDIFFDFPSTVQGLNQIIQILTSRKLFVFHNGLYLVNAPNSELNITHVDLQFVLKCFQIKLNQKKVRELIHSPS